MITPESVRKRADAVNVSLRQLLLRAGIARSTFWRWERGGGIYPRTTRRISDTLSKYERGEQ
jgi:transcriptional regulator with XRE-family HTH domain